MTTVTNENDDTVSVEQEISNPFAKRPHVVILGAGASKAAFPKGDVFGNRLPIMDELIDILKLENELRQFNLHDKYSNFESLYSFVADNSNYSKLVTILEERIDKYFSKLQLPAEPTLYDHLVMSLRPKDVIATFNWDPLLFLVCSRIRKYIDIPKVLYLHGNVAIGHCLKDSMKGTRGHSCPTCRQPYKPSKLLFPVLHKNYNMDEYISREWKSLKKYLQSAFVFTIFGYGAPTSDIEAVSLMNESWGPGEERNLEEIEIIDIKSEDTIHKTWSSFIHTHYYSTTNDFYKSIIAMHPRRSVEAVWTNVIDAKYTEENPIPKDMDFDALRTWYGMLKQAET